ncbi:MAG: AraC family transcriptional regulator [Clostridia bacterium]|nr:AraC family transcriptional regulator [Clostridia bacterium]
MDAYFENYRIRNLELPHLNPLMAGRQQCPPDYRYGPVMRQYYIVEYVFAGRGVYTVNGRPYPAEAGEAFIIRPYEVHILHADREDPWEYAWFGFETDLPLPRLLAERYVFSLPECGEIFSRLQKGIAEPELAGLIYRLFAAGYAQEKREEKKPGDAIDRALAIIREEYPTVTVEKLAARLFFNRSYFGALFKKRTGKTPKEYIDDLRLSTAARLMGEFGYTATQAGAAVGYPDCMTFSKMYKRHFGVSPRGSLDAEKRKGKTILLK